jgi:putative drug exporter of the RND superfamily
MFAHLARFVSRHWVLVLLAWVAIPLAVAMVAPRWEDVTRDGDFAYLPARMTSARGERLLGLAFPNLNSKSQIVLVVARPDGGLQADDFAVAERLAQTFTPKEGEQTPVTSVWSHEDPVVGRKLLSPIGQTGQAVLVMLQLDSEFMAIGNMKYVAKVYQRLKEIQQEAGFPAGLELGVTGSAAVGSDMLFSAEESIRNTELATIGMVVLILLLVYRAPGLVIVPLLAIGVSMQLSTDLIGLLARLSERVEWFDFRIFKTTKIYIVVILFGAATDYCLFLISRYREELQRGLEPPAAIEEALSQVGHALAASAMTVILGLGAMVFADFGKFRYGGPTMALSCFIALAACLTVAPALLRAAGRKVFWPFGVGSADALHAAVPGAAAVAPSFRKHPTRYFWENLARIVVTRPGLILVGSL